MFACLLFYEFRVLNKNAKLKGENINTIPTLIGIVCYAGIVQFEFTKIKGARIILHVKWPTLRAAKSPYTKGFYSILQHKMNSKI